MCSCFKQAQAKFSIERAREALDWVEAVLQRPLPFPSPDEGLRDQLDFAHVLKDGIALCEYVYIRLLSNSETSCHKREHLDSITSVTLMGRLSFERSLSRRSIRRCIGSRRRLFSCNQLETACRNHWRAVASKRWPFGVFSGKQMTGTLAGPFIMRGIRFPRCFVGEPYM